MEPEKSYPPAKNDEVGAVMGWLREFFRQFQLAWRLFRDPRIPFSLKVVPLATAAYFISPVDFIPDVAFGLGQLDDIAIILIGMRLFIDLCPPAIVAEHQAAIAGERGEAEVWTPPREVIDVEAKRPALEED